MGAGHEGAVARTGLNARSLCSASEVTVTRIMLPTFRKTIRSLRQGAAGPTGACWRAFDLTTMLSAVCVVTVICVATPAVAQINAHGAGIGWTGSHGGVGWDGGHAYSGGGYAGFPPAYRAVPPVRPIPVKPRYDWLSALSTLSERRVDPSSKPPRRPAATNMREKQK